VPTKAEAAAPSSTMASSSEQAQADAAAASASARESFHSPAFTLFPELTQIFTLFRFGTATATEVLHSDPLEVTLNICNGLVSHNG